MEVGTSHPLCQVRHVTEFTRSMCECAAEQSTSACRVTGAQICHEELGHHRRANRLFPFFPSATQDLSGTGRAAAPQQCRTNAPLSTASGAASALTAKPSSQPRNLHCCALVGLRHSHDHQAKRTQVLLDQEETDQAPHIFIHDQETTKTTSQREKRRIRIADDVHQHHQYHSCAPHYHLQQLAMRSPVQTQDRGLPTSCGENRHDQAKTQHVALLNLCPECESANASHS